MLATFGRFTPHRLFLDFSRWVIKFPLLSIFLPLLTFSILAYPSLPYFLGSGSCESSYLSKIDLESYHNELTPDLSLFQVLINYVGHENILKKGSLLESLAIQNRLLLGVADSELADFIQTPFGLWNNSLQLLQRDRSPLKTINSRLKSFPRLLLRKVSKVNGFVSSAENVVINIFASADHQRALREKLDYNIAELQSLVNVTGFGVASQGLLLDDDNQQEVLRFNLSPIEKRDILVGCCLFITLLIHLSTEFNRVAYVKSKSGIVFALVVNILISTAMSTTLTQFLFKDYTENVPIALMWLPVVFIASTNLLMLLEGTAGSVVTGMNDQHHLTELESEDKKSTRSFVITSASANASALTSTMTSLALSTLLFPFNRRLSFFLTVALLSSFILQITFFTSVVSLDLKRLSSTDYLFLNKNEEPNAGCFDKEQWDRSETYFERLKSLIRYIRRNATHRPMFFSLPYFVLINQRFSSVRSSSSLLYKLFFGHFTKLAKFSFAKSPVLVDSNSVCTLLLEKYGSGSFYVSVSPSNRIFAIKGGTELSGSVLSTYIDNIQSPFVTSYKFDLYFFFEFALTLILISSTALLILQSLLSRVEFPSRPELDHAIELPEKTISKRRGDAQIGVDSFHIKELSQGGHSLDIIDIATSESPFIISLGIDRKLFVWSPLSTPVPLPTEIPLGNRLWPVSKIVTSASGNFTAIFSKNGRVACWSRRTMSFLWTTKLDAPEVVLEAFFRKKTTPAHMRNKLKSTGNMVNKGRDFPVGNLLSRTRRDSGVSLSSMKSSSSIPAALDAHYTNTTAVTHDEDDAVELVFITAVGLINCVDTDGNMSSDKLTNSLYPLISCKKLITPRVNDRLVICDLKANIYISTVVNNKWRTRKLVVIKNSFNRGQKLMTPATLQRHHDEADQAGNRSLPDITAKTSLLLIPFVGMLLLAKDSEAELVDAQTGTSIKTFKLSSYEPGSLRVFHDEPTHCKFCGSASVASLSIAYTLKSTTTLIMHTFKLESRTKTSICLRVERDPREIRCLGLESVVEKKHDLSEVDGWNVTDNNMIIGLRRKDNSSQRGGESQTMMRSVSEDARRGETRLRNRLESRSMKPSRSVEYNIHDIWEGWTMTVNGKVTYYRIPVGVNGLLTSRIGPLKKFGAKAIVAAFGNIMKVLYLGREELILTSDGLNTNEDESSLKFVNKRRQRLNEKKVSSNYSQL